MTLGRAAGHQRGRFDLMENAERRAELLRELAADLRSVWVSAAERASDWDEFRVIVWEADAFGIDRS